ncbi:hypothetical protein GGF42_001300 [Coemansia sp. RSA 2424]|nr:hypothetical protein GGF42_001300 [Coemansia sp. RSA 2424]
MYTDPAVRDFWCFQGGSHHWLHTNRLVQGNSESPSLLEHILGSLPELQGKLLIYIDNIYLRSMDGDMTKHLREIGTMTRALAEYNLLRIATLLDLPMPRTISEIRRMPCGLNSISRHLPWVQAALLPFYQKTAKVCLTARDMEELAPHWQTVRQCLSNVEHLYVPPPGAPLTLRVDTASARVGAVLLAQKSEDPEDKAPVAYFSKATAHSTWREAKAVVGLFSHKTRGDTDDGEKFTVGLTSLGISKDMLVHRPGVQHHVYSHMEASDLPEP